MADIHPFRAFRFDPLQVTLAQVVTQPYDKITPALQERYYAASPNNLVRIILGRRRENDNPANNVYTRAAGHFRDWRQQGLLREDSAPSIDVYKRQAPERAQKRVVFSPGIRSRIPPQGVPGSRDFAR